MFSFEPALHRKDAEEARLARLQIQQQEGMIRMGPMVSADQEAYTQSRFRVLKRAGKQTLVCRHWLKNICGNGNACDYVHHYEVSKLPVCQAFAATGICRDKMLNCCPFLHTRQRSGDAPRRGHLECVFYFLGFCPFGNRCRLTHVKRPSALRPDVMPKWYIEFVLGHNAHDLDPNDSLMTSKLEKLNSYLAQFLPASQAVLANDALILQSPWGLPKLSCFVDTEGLQKLYRDVAYAEGERRK